MSPITPQVTPNPAPIEPARPTSASKMSDASQAAAPARSFADTMRATATTTPASPTPLASEGGVVRNVLQNVAAGHREMDRIIQMAQSGRSFSSAQLIGLQARVFRISTEIDLASKLLEKVTAGVKQTMSTQV